ncbi:hypothetical protein VUR80DRAFT_416 [Thermomyces stellatus]
MQRLVLLIAPLLAAAAADRPAGDRTLTSPEDSLPLDKRACEPDGGRCKPDFAGVYCANCFADEGGIIVQLLGNRRSTSHVYRCDRKGRCCDYDTADGRKHGVARRSRE